ncbi:hypothetical protein ACQ4PT_001547 [Festuca glaucescens]
MAAPPSPQPHVMVLPFPAQGHVMPLMELSHRLVDHGLQVDFVNTDFNHDRLLNAMAAETGAVPDGIHMVSFPDGMGPDGDRIDITMLGDSLPATMLGPLEEMIRSKKIKWLISPMCPCAGRWSWPSRRVSVSPCSRPSPPPCSCSGYTFQS